MKVPFVDLKIQYKQYKKEIDRAISDTLIESQFVHGKAVERFEKKFASYIGAPHCIGLNSGTDALILGFRALELSPGAEVIVQANTYIASALGASENGLKPVFVDCDPVDYGMDIADLKNVDFMSLIIVTMTYYPTLIRKLSSGSKRHFRLLASS